MTEKQKQASAEITKIIDAWALKQVKELQNDLSKCVELQSQLKRFYTKSELVEAQEKYNQAFINDPDAFGDPTNQASFNARKQIEYLLSFLD